MDELDDIFRQELDGHATAPGADLWARLQARTAPQPPAADADPLDARFRAELAAHATPPRRELWERLEDEHLRPRQRRRPVVAWGRLAVAASLLLLVLAGGAGLWRNWWGQPAGPVAATGQVGHAGATSQPGSLDSRAASPNSQPVQLASHAAAGISPATAEVAVAGHTIRAAVAAKEAAGQLSFENKRTLAANEQAGHEKKRKSLASQATGPGASPSSSPVASTSRPRRAATTRRPVPALPATTSQPDAAMNTLAQDGGLQPPPGPPSLAPTAAPEAYVVEVEVRRGPDPTAPVPAAVAATEPAPRRVRVVGLLQQADHLLHGEPASLRQAAIETAPITLQARLGGRVISKTIRF